MPVFLDDFGAFPISLGHLFVKVMTLLTPNAAAILSRAARGYPFLAFVAFHPNADAIPNLLITILTMFLLHGFVE